MGRSYCFECSKCGYRAIVSGGMDRGVQFWVQTVHCLDCRALHDALTRLKAADERTLGGLHKTSGIASQPGIHIHRYQGPPPTFAEALGRLQTKGAKRSRWVQFGLHCPVSKNHRVQAWNDPGKCPRCGAFLEKSSLPYRLWD